jgi:hypothetical protein
MRKSFQAKKEKTNRSFSGLKRKILPSRAAIYELRGITLGARPPVKHWRIEDGNVGAF